MPWPYPSEAGEFDVPGISDELCEHAAALGEGDAGGTAAADD